MKLQVSLKYSGKTSCFELKLFQNEPKKLSLGDATVKQKIGRCINIRGVSNSYGFKGSAAFLLKLPKLFSLLVHDMRLKMVQMGHITSFLTLAHKFVVVFDFENML